MVHELTDDNVKQLIETGKPVVIDCWAVWCGPCRRVAPMVEELAERYAGRVEFGKYDVDEGGGDLLAEYGVRNIPTLLFFKDGQFVDRMVGASSIDAFAAQIETLL